MIKFGLIDEHDSTEWRFIVDGVRQLKTLSSKYDRVQVIDFANYHWPDQDVIIERW